MNKLTITIICLFFSMNVLSQIVENRANACGFLQSLKYKNGVDTVIFTATLKDVTEDVGGGNIFKTLDKEKKLNSKNFVDQVGLQPDGCTKIYYAPLHKKADPEKVLVPININAKAYITCVAFKRHEWENEGVPFFVVIKISLKKP